VQVQHRERRLARRRLRRRFRRAVEAHLHRGKCRHRDEGGHRLRRFTAHQRHVAHAEQHAAGRDAAAPRRRHAITRWQRGQREHHHARGLPPLTLVP
jgi:hypothetical protein